MAQENAVGIYTSRVEALAARAAEEALSDAIQSGYKSADVGLINTLSNFVKSIQAKMAYKEILD